VIDDRPAIAKVSVYILYKDAVGKTYEEVCELLDREIYAFIVFRDERSPVRHIPKEYWQNYEKLHQKKVQLPPYR
jgi:hypothetical protein